MLKALVDAATMTATHNVINVLCHSQPCPISNQGPITTAFCDLVPALQDKIGSSAYIEITHAVPLKFNMDQVPHSPATTPNLLPSQGQDYFNMTTFSKAVVATDYQDALINSVPSSPHPVVAPSTIQISLLERYIPPTAANEYMDLFSMNGPSALVNRLTELSTSGGSLLFIYPTQIGAATFAHQYLGPLLDPLLRTMAGIYGLTSDLGVNISKIAAIESMLSFDVMARKLNLLLRKLGRGSSGAGNRPSPKLEIAYSSTQTVVLESKSWTEWWIHQEKDRIHETLKRYFQRGYRVPTREMATPGTLCREILDGVRTRSLLAGDNAMQQGVEVGVFVIKRSA